MERCSAYSVKKRITALIVAVVLILLLLCGKIFYLSVIDGESLQAKALDQWTRDLPLTAKRGNILDANGNLIVASKTLYNVYLRPKNTEDLKGTVKSICNILSLNYDSLYQKASKKNISEVTVARKVDKKYIDIIIEQNVKGIYFSEDIDREYLYNDLLCQVLGFTSIDNVGQSGIEKYYNKYLQGMDGKSLVEGDIIGKEIEDGNRYYIPAVDGLNVTLTIDLKIQQIVENALKTAMIANKPKSASCIVMRPDSGEIVAMGSLPNFDLNAPPRDDITSLMSLSRAKMIVDIYEPGSTFKVLTASASLEEYYKGNKAAFSKEHIFANNSRSRTIDGQNIKCWDGHTSGKHSQQNLGMALNNSCNPIFVDIAMNLGTDVFYDYINKFGYGKLTGIDFDGESGGMVIPKYNVKNCDLARIGFGQTIAVTPLQLISATAAAINGGKYYTPHLVSKITDKNGNLAFRQSSAPTHTVISQRTSSDIASMLEEVVTRGSGKLAYIEGARVGGKTGTAQKYENGHIAQGKNIMSFVGFYPSNAPRYICLFVVDEPFGGGFGSTIAAPYVKTIFEQIITYENT